MQGKKMKELDASLALPLTSRACLAFLKRHLAVSQHQGELIDRALQTNTERVAAAQAVLDKAAAAAAKKEGMPHNGE